MECVNCKSQLEPAHVEETIVLGEYKIALVLPARRCNACGENYIDSTVSERGDLIVAGRLLDLGIATGAAFRFMRKALGFPSTILATLLGVDVATISRWENSKVPVDRCALATLAAAATERLAGREETISRLRALREGKQPDHVLRVEFTNAS